MEDGFDSDRWNMELEGPCVSVFGKRECAGTDGGRQGGEAGRPGRGRLSERQGNRTGSGEARLGQPHDEHRAGLPGPAEQAGADGTGSDPASLGLPRAGRAGRAGMGRGAPRGQRPV